MTTESNSFAGGNTENNQLRQWAFRLETGQKSPATLARSWFRIIFIMLHEFTTAAISLRAAALTYSIVLSMVPLLAMSTAILKGMGGGDQLKVAAYRLIDQLEPGGRLLPETSPAATRRAEPAVTDNQNSSQVQQETAAATDFSSAIPPDLASKEPQVITMHLRRAVDTIFNYVDRTNFAAIGAFGIVGLLLTVILVMSTIENAMNAIWHTSRGRSLLRKIMDYLALLLLLPVTINVAIAGDAILASPKIMAHLHTVIPSAWAIKTLLQLLPFFFFILSLTVMYMFFPNVRVTTSAAFTGAIFAGIFWFLGQKLYIFLQVGLASSNAIYGSFATVPLFLVWVQFGWTFILLGATLAYAVQNRNQYRLPGSGTSPQRQLQLAFDVLNVIHVNFTQKKPSTFAGLVTALEGEQPGDILTTTDSLVQGGFLYRTDEGNPAFVPTTPPEILDASDIVLQVLGKEAIPTPGGRLARTVISAAAKAIPRAAFPNLHQTPNSSTDTLGKEADSEKTL